MIKTNETDSQQEKLALVARLEAVEKELRITHSPTLQPTLEPTFPPTVEPTSEPTVPPTVQVTMDYTVPLESNTSYVMEYSGFIPVPINPRAVRRDMIRSDVFPAFDGNCVKGSAQWQVCDPNPLAKVDRSEVKLAGIPETTRWGEPAGDFVDRVLQKAW